MERNVVGFRGLQGLRGLEGLRGKEDLHDFPGVTRFQGLLEIGGRGCGIRQDSWKGMRWREEESAAETDAVRRVANAIW
jgi:hypothetical protein